MSKAKKLKYDTELFKSIYQLHNCTLYLYEGKVFLPRKNVLSICKNIDSYINVKKYVHYISISGTVYINRYGVMLLLANYPDILDTLNDILRSLELGSIKDYRSELGSMSIFEMSTDKKNLTTILEELETLKNDYAISEHELKENNLKYKKILVEYKELEVEYNNLLTESKKIAKYVRIKSKNPPDAVFDDQLIDDDIDDDNELDIKDVSNAKKIIIATSTHNRISPVKDKSNLPSKKITKNIETKSPSSKSNLFAEFSMENSNLCYLMQSVDYQIIDDFQLHNWYLTDKLPDNPKKVDMLFKSCTDAFDFKKISSDILLEGSNENTNKYGFEYIWYKDILIAKKDIKKINRILTAIRYLSIDQISEILNEFIIEE
jgi:hypothetical protein